MADQGPLVRVDTDGRGTLIKMTRKEAEAYVAANAIASVVGAPNLVDAPSAFVEPAQVAVVNEIDAMKKADLIALAKERGLDTRGTAEELRERLRPEPEAEDGDESETEDNAGDDSQE